MCVFITLGTNNGQIVLPQHRPVLTWQVLHFPQIWDCSVNKLINFVQKRYPHRHRSVLTIFHHLCSWAFVSLGVCFLQMVTFWPAILILLGLSSLVEDHFFSDPGALSCWIFSHSEKRWALDSSSSDPDEMSFRHEDTLVFWAPHRLSPSGFRTPGRTPFHPCAVFPRPASRTHPLQHLYLFDPWEIMTQEWELSVFVDIILISSPYLPCKQQVLTSNTGPILVFPLIQPFGSDLRLLATCIHDRPLHLWIVKNSAVSFVMKYCPISTTLRNPASIQNVTQLVWLWHSFSIRSPYLLQ